MAKKKGIHAHTWAMHALADELANVHEIRDTLLDALAAKLLQIQPDAIADIAAHRRGMTDADYIEVAERSKGIDTCLLVGTITDVLSGRYTRISVQEALLMCRRAGLRPRITLIEAYETKHLKIAPADWSGFFASDMTVSADFMADSERMPVQERTF